jgi:hypothetical protein
MSGIEITIRLVGVLAGYLWIKHWQRVGNWSEQYDPAKWTGRAMDVARLKGRVAELRSDYLKRRVPTRGVRFHRSVLDLARQLVARLAYFHDRESESPGQSRRL